MLVLFSSSIAVASLQIILLLPFFGWKDFFSFSRLCVILDGCALARLTRSSAPGNQVEQKKLRFHLQPFNWFPIFLFEFAGCFNCLKCGSKITPHPPNDISIKIYRGIDDQTACSSTRWQVRVERKISFNEVIGWQRRWRQQRAGFCRCGFLPCLNIFQHIFLPFFFKQQSKRHRRDATLPPWRRNFRSGAGRNFAPSWITKKQKKTTYR